MVPGIIAYSMWGLKLGIDFQGGTLWEIKFIEEKTDTEGFKHFLESNEVEVSTISSTAPQSWVVCSPICPPRT